MKLIIALLLVVLAASQTTLPSRPPGFGPLPANCRPPSNCNLVCPYRFRFGNDGCEICQCKTSPCINETAILPNAVCDRTTNGPKCPSTHDCVVPRDGPPPRPPGSSSPSASPSPPPTPSPSTRGVCCIHVDFEAVGIRPPRPVKYWAMDILFLWYLGHVETRREHSFRCGLVVRIGRSHRLGPGSIPGTGIFFSFHLLCNANKLSLS